MGSASEAAYDDSPATLDSVFDWQRLAELAELIDGTDAGFLIELFDSFFDGSTETLQQIRTASDQETVRRAVHTLKGCSSNVGAVQVESQCKKLEAHIERGQTLTDAQFEELRQCLDVVKRTYQSALARLLESAPSP